jgi:hypothetical protein
MPEALTTDADSSVPWFFGAVIPNSKIVGCHGGTTLDAGFLENAVFTTACLNFLRKCLVKRRGPVPRHVTVM